MAKVPERPFFLGGRRRLGYESLLMQEDCAIERVNGVVSMSIIGSWSDRHMALAREYDVADVSLTTSSFGGRETAEFLLDMPRLTGLSINLYSAKDLTALGLLHHLESLRIYLTVWDLGARFKPVDFSGLTRLAHVEVMMCGAFESVLSCASIRELSVGNDCDRRLRDLDLSRLHALRDLRLDHCPKLRSVIFHPRARIRSLELSLCGSYRPDWRRIGRDIRFLQLGGRLGFPLEHILGATRLQELHTAEIRKLPPLGFLRQMPHLKTVSLFAAPPGLNLSDEDRAIVAEINARADRGRRK